tara:strand:- start:116 stop:907 length:792 start_codon:yes stop_codon:yes gene_type:complete
MSEKKQYDLTVLTIKDPPLPDPIEQDPRLPNVTAGACILDVARPRAGKSVRTVNYFLNPNFFAEKFDEVFIYSPTMSKGDHSTRHLFDRYKNTIYNTYSDKHLQGLLDHLDSIPKPRGRFALVFDDFISFGHLKPTSLMFRIASSYRHHLNGGMLLYNSQQLKKVPPIVRASVNYVIVSQNSNLKQVEAMAEEFGSTYGTEKWLQLFAEATSEPYSFLYMDLYGYTGNNDGRPKAYKRFDTLLYEAPINYSKKKQLSPINEDT